MSLLEELYATPEIERAFEQGRRYEQRAHKCPIKILVRYKKSPIPRAEHPRSRWKKFGVVCSGRLLNGTYDTEAQAGMALAGLVPASPANRERVKIDAQVVKLF